MTISPNPDAYIRRIMASPGWSGSVVIEATQDEGVAIFWRTEEQGKEREDYGPDAVGPTVLDALARAAADADALSEPASTLGSLRAETEAGQTGSGPRDTGSDGAQP